MSIVKSLTKISVLACMLVGGGLVSTASYAYPIYGGVYIGGWGYPGVYVGNYRPGPYYGGYYHGPYNGYNYNYHYHYVYNYNYDGQHYHYVYNYHYHYHY